MRQLVAVALCFLGHCSASDGTYWSLAKDIVPQTADDAFTLLPMLCPTAGPDEVKPLRKAILAARDALDIFSFAYPEETSPTQADTTGGGQRVEAHGDMWWRLRRDLDAGYEVIGDFQDLAHSLVDYNSTDEEAALAVCLDWLNCMVANRERYQYDAYVASPSDDELVTHKHMSKFFWGYGGRYPDSSLTGRENMARLLTSQLTQVLDNYTVVTAFEHVYSEPDHTRFHLFRKLVRSMLAVIQFAPDLLPEPELAQAQRVSHSRAMLAGSLRGKTSRKLVGGQRPANRLRLGDPGCDTQMAVSHFQDLFKVLGKVNDQVFAANFYHERGMEDKAEEARLECDKQWDAVLQWMKEIQLEELVHCVVETLSMASLGPYQPRVGTHSHAGWSTRWW